MEDAHRVGPAADAGEDDVREPADEVEDLGAGLDTDDAVEVADHLGERGGAGHRAEDVVRLVDGGDPVAQRLVDGVLEGLAAGRHGHDLGAEQSHPGVQVPLGVDLAHVDGAVEAE